MKHFFSTPFTTKRAEQQVHSYALVRGKLWKKARLGLIVFGLVISAAGAAPVAYAAVGDSCDPADGAVDTCNPTSNPAGDYCGAIGSTIGKCVARSQLTADQATAQTQVDKVAAATPATYKGDSSPGSPYNYVMIKIMELFAWLLGVAALTLNYAAYYTVVTMGDYVNHLSAIGVTWRILRDIGNIMLIFGFLAVGITTILNVDWYGGGKKMLPMMLVAAVFLNFSLFISEAIIDTGNIFATQFYKQIVGGTLPTQSSSGLLTVTTVSGVANLNPSNEGISNAIMSKLGLQTIYGNGIANPKIFDAGNPWLIGFMGIILFIITAFVMFSLAFILIARFVALIFLIILAPVGFAGLAVPMLAKRAGQWWSKLFEQTITAPILLLMLYIALTVITDQQFLMGSSGGNIANGAWTGLVGNGNIAGFAGILLSFLIAMGLLLLVVIQSKNLSAFGAAGATKLAGKLSFGATAWAGRTSVGWGSHRLGKYLKSTRVGRIPLVGTGLVKGLDKIGAGSFDVRGIGMGGGLKGIGVEAGEAQKGGYKADLKARIDSRTKYASELTGRELTDEEKAKQLAKQNQIKEAQKKRAKSTDPAEIERLDKGLKVLEKDLEDIESVTDKGAQRKYAGNLELDYLGLKPKGVFNTYFNFAANTESAKIIRATAKKGKPDKDFTTNMKNLLKEAAKESGEETETGPTTPPVAASTTPPPSSPTAASGGGVPPTP